MRFHDRLAFVAIAVAVALASKLTRAQGVATADAVDAGAEARYKVPDTDDGIPGAGPIRRNEWFRNTWRERRMHFAERDEQDREAVVFFGDSITQGWSDDFHALFPGMKAANRGLSGDTTRAMIYRLEEDVLALEPKAVVMLMGTNDLDEQNTPPDIIAANIELIIERLKAHDEKLPVILCLVMPSSQQKNRPADKVKEVNRLVIEAMKDEPQVRVLDTWTLFANDEGDAKPEEFPDLLHPNELGYAKWAAALRPVFATLGLLENEPDSWKPEAGFESLFNGRDLTGWGYRPTPPHDFEAIANWKKADPNMPPWPIVKEASAFDRKTESNDGRYVARNGRLVVTMPVEGRRIQQLWTTREFAEPFVLRLEFRATPNADSGVFIRQPQLQCRDYPLAGPYKDLKNYKPQDWNQLEVVVTGNSARATCNGEVLEEKMAVPASGPIGLEGDRGQMEYRRIRVKVDDSAG